MTTLGASSCFHSKGTRRVYGLHINVYMYYSNVKHIPNYANRYEEDVNNWFTLLKKALTRKHLVLEIV